MIVRLRCGLKKRRRSDECTAYIFTAAFNGYRICHRVNADSDCLGGKIRRGTYGQVDKVMYAVIKNFVISWGE